MGASGHQCHRPLCQELPGLLKLGGIGLREVVTAADGGLGNLAGLSFALKYPASLTLTDKQVGALPFWNESAGQVSLAAIRSTTWAIQPHWSMGQDTPEAPRLAWRPQPR